MARPKDRPLVELSDVSVYTMRELNQRTAQVIAEINASGLPALITRHGRFLAMITPLEGTQIESLVLSANPVGDEGPTGSRSSGDERTYTSEEVLDEHQRRSPSDN